jgi:hypothetical protein
MSKTASASNTLTRQSEGVASVKKGADIEITKDAWTFGILTICDEPNMCELPFYIFQMEITMLLQ